MSFKQRTVKSTICILILMGSILLAGIYGSLKLQQEKTNALLMQTMLINIAIAQEAYYDKQKSFAAQWKQILPDIARPASTGVMWTEVPGQPDVYYMGFGKKELYKVYLRLTDQQLFISANRIHAGLLHYQLQYSLPDQQTQCKGNWGMQLFCSYILKQIEQLDVKNLVPVTQNAS